MAKWDNLPLEVKLQIIQNLQKEAEGFGYDQWPYVSQLFYAQGTALHFETVEFIYNVKPIHQKMHAIIYSPFNPGQWVKTVNLSILSAPKDWRQDLGITSEQGYDLQSDKLFQFMTLCPDVTAVKPRFSYADIDAVNEACLYFFFIASKTQLWKLKRVPLHNAVPFKYLYQLRDSLTEINIDPSMEDYKVLSEFTQLKTVVLKDLKIKNITAIQEYLQYLPHLESLEVSRFIEDDADGEEKKKLALVEQKVYPRIHTLNLSSVYLVSEKDIQFILQSFPALSNLTLSIYSNYAKPGLYHLSVLYPLMERLLTMKAFRIRSDKGDKRIMDAYLLACKNLSASTPITSKLKIVSMEQGDDALLIKKQDGIVSLNWQAEAETWNNDNDEDDFEEPAETEAWEPTLPSLISCFESVQIDHENYEHDIGSNLKILCTTPSPVRNVKFMEGLLEAYSSEVSNSKKLDSLVFERVLIDDLGAIFPALSQDLASVDNLTFSGDCRFNEDTEDNLWNISMPQTAVGTLKICSSLIYEKEDAIVLFSVKLEEKDIQKCHIWDSQERNVLKEVTKPEYASLAEDYEAVSGMTLVTLRFKSLEKLVITSDEEDCFHPIDICFA